ncbi:hypothetical protein D3C81_1521830 [compost metagenome]
MTSKLNEDAPNEAITAPASTSPSVLARRVPRTMPTIRTNTERDTYCALISEFVKPRAFMTAMEYPFFATSIFINSSVTSIVMTRATTIAVKEAFPTELIVEPNV